MTFKLLLALVSALVLVNIVNCQSSSDEFRVVKTKSGQVRGIRNVTLFDEKPFYTFNGIPFAKPPLGHLRFKPPQPVDPWDDIKDAFQMGSECVQNVWNSENIVGNEDCLYLNIYVPITKSVEKLPVMFFIHGGGFIMGSAKGSGPDFLIDNDVIMVSINYRLGVFGFMSLGTAEYSGNMGLKDQSLALKWVNENIEYFGGDKSKITIFGVSAGGASTHYQVISPMSKGLFQRAIIQSGTVLNPWAYRLENNHLKEMKELAKKFGKVSGYYDDIVNYLVNVDAKLLAESTICDLYPAGKPRKTSDIIWSPLVEVADALEPFLTEFPGDILSKTELDTVDTMFGFTSDEMYTLMAVELHDPSLLETFAKSFELQLPKKYLKYDYNSKEYKQIAKDIRKFYFGKNGIVGKETLQEYNTMISDIWFVYGTVESAKLQSRRSTGKTFLYQFSLESKLNLLKVMSGASALNLRGTAHGDDMMYLFRLNEDIFFMPSDFYANITTDSLELKLIRDVSRLWTNFAKYGSPTLPTDLIEFKPIENDEINYGDITNDGLVAGVNPFQKNIKFWDGLYKKYQHVFQSNVLRKDEL